MGTISSEDPAVRVHLLVKTEKSDGDEKPSRGNITAAAGSESQLHRVEQELNQCKSSTPGAVPKLEHQPKVNIMPFSVNLTRLSDATISKYTKQLECLTVKTIKTLHLKRLTIPVKCLPLTPSQNVILQSPYKTARPNTATQSTESTSKKVVKKSAILVDIPQDNNRHLHFNFSNTP